MRETRCNVDDCGGSFEESAKGESDEMRDRVAVTPVNVIFLIKAR